MGIKIVVGLAYALKPIHFLKAHVDSYSKTAKEHKYKDKDDYKYKDKDEGAKTITGTLTLCPVQSGAAQYSLVPPSTV